MEFRLGYIPGCIGRIARLHADYYARTAGFGIEFEAKVAGTCRFLPGLPRRSRRTLACRRGAKSMDRSPSTARTTASAVRTCAGSSPNARTNCGGCVSNIGYCGLGLAAPHACIDRRVHRGRSQNMACKILGDRYVEEVRNVPVAGRLTVAVSQHFNGRDSAALVGAGTSATRPYDSNTRHSVTS